MKSEKQKMLEGRLYDPMDPQLVEERIQARELCQRLNVLPERDEAGRRRILQHLLKKGGDTAWLQPPFFCDYGYNIELGSRVYFNFDCVVLDVCKVTIGDFCFFGPSVQIYTGTHPMQAAQRRTHEFAKPVTIGSDVWVGGGAIILPGVSVGSGSVIGAGSVVTKDVPQGVVAVGNPCRVLRQIGDDEM